MNNKILISVLSLNKEPYISLEKTIRNTWSSEKHGDVEIIYYYGSSNEIKLDGDKLFLDEPEGLTNVGRKTLKMFEYILDNYQFDYLFRTNSSSYVNIPELINFIKDKPKDGFCSAIFIGTYGSIDFPSGSGYFLSKDVIRLVLENKNKWNHKLIDDLSLGKVLHDLKIKIFKGVRVDLYPGSKYYKNIKSNTVPISYHYRVKDVSNRNNDIKIMNYLHNIFNT